MTWGTPLSFPRAILHIDGDSFFAACEVAKDPSLRGKPVITGKERGIVSACTYEAKAMGVKRGSKLSDVLKVCPEAIILPSDYETYSLFSKRMYEIVRRYTPMVEEYSIDECFADLTGLRRLHRASYADIAARIKADLERELGMTFAMGLAPTKVLAKIGSKWKKPAGLTPISLKDAQLFLAQTPVGKLWGIGHNTEAFLHKYGVRTALDLAQKDESWVRSTLAKPYVEIWQELNGEVVNELNTEGKHTYYSISKTKTFTPPSTDAAFIFSQLSKNIENACIKARRWSLAAPAVSVFLKTQDFSYHTCELTLAHATCVPQDILEAVRAAFPRLYKKGVRYRATGITLLKLTDSTTLQLDLFGEQKQSERFVSMYKSVDSLSKRYGKHAVFLGSSLTAMAGRTHTSERGDTTERAKHLFKGETQRRHLAIPFLGDVS